ncbi:MAG: single-stranded-DNA-specific exonuclease RecJ [Candidatus Endonucleobacter sp. (ex Gigantidas childressi)]|nr:single-stranded-DNA-specific exonuclease RecJ [Candidatus Endonucleobacter sp. (ex Gigantidas childressi)]
MMARIYNARGINNEKSLTRKLKELPDYHQLKDIDKASNILSDAITSRQKILIIGDFDCDGATSSALGLLALRKMGACANYLVPNRFEYGYGLTPEIVHAATKYQPDILVTVDNGISSIEGVADAKSRGMKVIVTDHHLAGDSLPNADAIVNPNQPNCPFPGKNTAGVGIIFYVMCALRQCLRENGWFTNHPEPNLASFLDLVALGTVADVVSLDSPNRILVSQGLARIRSNNCRLGIKALAEVSGRDITQLTAPDLGYALGPRLNAAGRLDDMSIGIELLITEHTDHAKELASKLNNLNQERKEIESGMQSEAIIELEQLQFNDDKIELPWGLCLFKDNWHQGVVGILASRIKEKLHRPVIIFAKVDNGEIKGSARSVPSLHIRDALDNIARKQPGLILKFGGHAMAAGLSIKKVDLPLFKKEFDKEVRSQLSKEHLNAEIHTDGELQPEDITIATAEHLKEGGPWGHNFSEPSFNGRFRVIEQRLVGKKHLKLSLKTLSSELLIDAIAFNIDPQLWPNPAIKQLDIVYKLDINKYRGQQRLQLLVDYLHTAP